MIRDPDRPLRRGLVTPLAALASTSRLLADGPVRHLAPQLMGVAPGGLNRPRERMPFEALMSGVKFGTVSKPGSGRPVASTTRHSSETASAERVLCRKGGHRVRRWMRHA